MNERGHQHVWLVAVHLSGHVRVVVEETSETFVDYSSKVLVRWLDNGDKADTFLWMSERSGFAHLYLYDKAGALLRTLTAGTYARRTQGGVQRVRGAVQYLLSHPVAPRVTGEWAVTAVCCVNESARTALIRTAGMVTGSDPYMQQLCLVHIDSAQLHSVSEVPWHRSRRRKSTARLPDRSTYCRVALAQTLLAAGRVGSPRGAIAVRPVRCRATSGHHLRQAIREANRTCGTH